MTSSALVLERQDWVQRIAKARRVTDELFAAVRAESLYERPIPERHRIVFYIGHLEAFDWNLLKHLAAAARSSSPDDAPLDQLFAFGIDPVDDGLPNDQPHDWPNIENVRKYVQERRDAIDEVLRSRQFVEAKIEGSASGEMLAHVALEHRLMHAETLAYMFHQLPHSAKCPPPTYESLPASRGEAPRQNSPMVEIPAGRITLGQCRGSGRFGWDNEFEAFDAAVRWFEIDRYMVSNGEFLEFVASGGYANEKLWTREDWQWRERNGIDHPVFWSKRGEEWFYRGMFEEVPLPLDWPVYVSYAEASAYAKWAKKVLPSEAQWQRAAYGTADGEERCYPWGEEAPSAVRGNFDFQLWDAEPVAAREETNCSAFGAVGMVGNGWEWTSSEFRPLPGFQAFSFYPGYSANFFDGKHFVIKGGSARTAAPLLRRSFRNWFQPHYQFMYAGFRCVRNPSD